MLQLASPGQLHTGIFPSRLNDVYFSMLTCVYRTCTVCVLDSDDPKESAIVSVNSLGDESYSQQTLSHSFWSLKAICRIKFVSEV